METYKTTISVEIHTALKLLGYRFFPETIHHLASIDLGNSIRATYELAGYWDVYDNDTVIFNLLQEHGEQARMYAK